MVRLWSRLPHWLAGCLIAIALMFSVAACGNDESREDADDVGNSRVDKSAPHVAAFNNHYPNVEHKCLVEGALEGQGGDDGSASNGTGLRVIVTTSKATVVIPDPHCPGFLPEQAGTVGVGPSFDPRPSK